MSKNKNWFDKRSRDMNKKKKENNNQSTDGKDKIKPVVIAQLNFTVNQGSIEVSIDRLPKITDESMLNLIRIAENKLRTSIFAGEITRGTGKEAEKKD